MNKDLKKQFKDEVIESLKAKGYDYKPFEISIDILVGMKVQELEFTNRLDNYTDTEEGKAILQETIELLKRDIEEYSEELMI